MRDLFLFEVLVHQLPGVNNMGLKGPGSNPPSTSKEVTFMKGFLFLYKELLFKVKSTEKPTPQDFSSSAPFAHQLCLIIHLFL